MRYRVSTGIADSLINGGFELSCSLSSSGSAQCSYARITDKMKCKTTTTVSRKGTDRKINKSGMAVIIALRTK